MQHTDALPAPAGERATAADAPRRVRAPSLRALLVGLILSAWLLPTLLALGLVWYDYREELAATEASALQAARSAARRADERFLQVKAGLEALASSPALAAGDLEAVRMHARGFVAANGAAFNVTVVDRHGEQVLNTAANPGPTRLKALPEFVALFREGAVAVSDVFDARVIAGPLVAVAVPARVQGEVKYVVAAGLSPASLQERVPSGRLPPSSTVSLVDRSGRLVTGPAVSQQVLQLPRTGDDAGVLRLRAPDGTERIAAFGRAPLSRYVALVTVPEHELRAPAERQAFIVAALALLVLGASVWLALRTGARISASVRALVRDDHAPGAGPFVRDEAFEEAAQLRGILEHTASQLQQARDEARELRREVGERRIALLEALLDASDQPMLVADAAGRIVALNTPATRLFGYSRAEATGLPMASVFRRDADATGTDDAFGTGTTRDGKHLPLRARVSPFVAGGHRYAALAFHRVEAGGAGR